MQLTVQSCHIVRGWSSDAPFVHTVGQPKSHYLPVNSLSMHTNYHTLCGASRLKLLSKEQCIS